MKQSFNLIPLSPYGQELPTEGFPLTQTITVDTPQPPEPEPYLEVLSPSTGEKWELGRNYEISWEQKKLEKITISLWGSNSPEVNASAGYSSHSISSLLNAEQGSYHWTVPKESSTSDFISRFQYFKICIDGYAEIPDGLPGKIAVRDTSETFKIVPTIKVKATLDGKSWEGPVIFDISRSSCFNSMDATGQFQVPKEFTGLYSDLPGGANIYLRYREKEGYQSGPEGSYLDRITIENRKGEWGRVAGTQSNS